MSSTTWTSPRSDTTAANNPGADPARFRVATADGAGVGRFLAAALREAVAAGGGVSVGGSSEAPVSGTRGVDFLFRRRERVELVRVGLDATGNVISAELFRLPPPPSPVGFREIELEALVDALAQGDSVAALRWQQSPFRPDHLEVLMRRDRKILVALGR